MNNTSFYSADRTTHLKIIVVSLVAATLVAVIGISARNVDLGTDVLTAQVRGPAIKAGQPVVMTGRDGVAIR
jgi:hypothetical protein